MASTTNDFILLCRQLITVTIKKNILVQTVTDTFMLLLNEQLVQSKFFFW